jgi:hypothetical protein
MIKISCGYLVDRNSPFRERTIAQRAPYDPIDDFASIAHRVTSLGTPSC